MTEFIYQVYVNDNNPQTAGVYIRKVVQEKIDPITDLPYLYQIDAMIPFSQGFSSDWIERRNLCFLQSWGPNNSSHQWLAQRIHKARRQCSEDFVGENRTRPEYLSCVCG